MKLKNMKVTAVNLKTELVTASMPIDLDQRTLVQLAETLLQLNQLLQGAGYTNIQVINYEYEPLSVQAQRAATHAELSLARERSEKNMRYGFDTAIKDLEYDVESYAKALVQTAEELPKLEAKSSDPEISAEKKQEAIKLINFIKSGLPRREEKYKIAQQQLTQAVSIKNQGTLAIYEYMRKKDGDFHEVEF